MMLGISLILFISTLASVSGFKTGLEEGLICNVCVGTHPGCGLYDFDQRWYWGQMCPRYNDKCVKLIERKGSEVMVTRDCLSNLENFRVDIPADKYEGCRPASSDVKIGQYVFNSIKELDIRRNYYDNTTYCFCDFDHWCNSSSRLGISLLSLISLVAINFMY
eukprot:TRINITY_DN29685_c0_g1_i2.p1 TRINITY_DN29685_c0_g1~~TRINITY_DN29685_c0_g1_i2.p1  ORF type:complete len:163 (-),score=9.24 TRINITY_DN29685_c0_g1_i2:86-574(-)